MKVKWKPIQGLVSLGVGLLLFSSIAPSAAAFTVQQSVTNEDNVSVNIKQIDNFKNLFPNSLRTSASDSLSQTLVSVLSHDKVGENGNYTVNATIQDILKYTYPNATDEQLNGLTINGEQAVNWLHHVGYTATLVNRPLTTDEIKKQLDDSDPIIPILTNQNNDTWLGESVAGVLYAHDDVVAGDQKLNKSFIETPTLGEAMVQDGQEAQPITFPNESNAIDPIQSKDTFLWAQTIMNVKQDPTANNVKTLNTNTKDGIFASKVTTSGGYSGVEFTEPLLDGLKNKAPDSPQITASAQVQNKGWLPESKNGEPIGTEGQGLRMEAFKVALSHLPAGETGGIAYSAHVQGIGWQNDVANGGIAGTVGKGLRVEALKMHLTGSLAEHYSIYYATQVQNIGWTPYVKDGEISGTTGKSLRVETISIRLAKKKLQKNPSDETKCSAVALVNLYEDVEHQKTVADLESFAGVAPTAAITSQQVMDWYHFLGLEFDTQAGRFSPDKAKNLSKTGRLYYTFLKAKTAPDNIQNFGAIGLGYMENSMSYSPYMSYLNEDYAPSAFWDPRGKESYSQMNGRMKTYDYDHIFTLDEQGKQASEYEEEVTLYNIRAKESTEVANVNPPADSPVSPVTPATPINASYHSLSAFNINETQGQEPWCSEYIAASAINTLNQTKDITAQSVMQSFYSNVSLEQLKTMSGLKIDDYLKTLQSKYQVTADVENRALNFDEVKKELDAGKMIQMDAYDQNETAPQGSEDNVGHSLAIVGYVLPADGDTTKHAPYYEIWNPWWGEIYCVSSKAPYFNLEGTQYKWTRTWHNWRKVGTGATVQADPAIAQQKVASAPNPEAIKVKTLPQLSPKVQLYNPKTTNPTDYLFQDSPLPQNNALNELSSEMQPPVVYRGIFGSNIDTHSYRASVPQEGKRRIMVATTVLNYSEKIYYDTDAAGRWRRDVNAGNRIEAELINDVKSIALSAALLAIGGAICKGFTVSATRINKIKNAIGYICSGLGLVGSSNIFEIARTISDYYENFDNLDNDWWDVQMAEHAP